MKKIEQDLVVYLLSRNDLTSMTAGKELAQAQHCGCQMISKYGNHKDVKEYLKQGKKHWADGFNTTITLETSGYDIQQIVSKAKKLGYVAGVLIDPSYPFWVDREIAIAYKMGEKPFYYKNEDEDKVLVTRNELTMGWLLGDRNDWKFRELINHLELKNYNKLIYDEKGDK